MIKLAIFSMLLGTPFVQTVPVTLKWTPGLIGTPAYYTLYYGPHRGHYGHSIESSTTTATVSVPVGKTAYFAVTATDALDRESPFSSEVVKTP